MATSKQQGIGNVEPTRDTENRAGKICKFEELNQLSFSCVFFRERSRVAVVTSCFFQSRCGARRNELNWKINSFELQDLEGRHTVAQFFDIH